jgi:hypothetical protein
MTTDPTRLPAGQEVKMIDVDWGQPFIDYIREQKVPTDKNLAQQLIHRAKSYVLVGDKLYKLWPALHGRHLLLHNSSHLLCELWHKFFYGGG